MAAAKKDLDAATTAWNNADGNATKSRVLVAGAGEAEKAAAEKKAADDQKSADALKSQRDHLEELYQNTVSARGKAQEERDKAEVALASIRRIGFRFRTRCLRWPASRLGRECFQV